MLISLLVRRSQQTHDPGLPRSPTARPRRQNARDHVYGRSRTSGEATVGRLHARRRLCTDRSMIAARPFRSTPPSVAVVSERLRPGCSLPRTRAYGAASARTRTTRWSAGLTTRHRNASTIAGSRLTSRDRANVDGGWWWASYIRPCCSAGRGRRVLALRPSGNDLVARGAGDPEDVRPQS